jgi:hypothetical protein
VTENDRDNSLEFPPARESRLAIKIS